MRVAACLVLTLACIFVGASAVVAKRAVPAAVAPVVHQRITYSAPRSQMGCIEAHQGRHLIYRRQIYVVKFDPNLERDVQDVFIKTLKLKDNALIVTNERGHQYRLDLKSLEVEVLTGSLVEQARKRREPIR